MATEIYAKVDELVNDRKLIEVYPYLKEEEEKNPALLEEPEFLWRYARAHFDASERETDPEKRKVLITKGTAIAEKGLKVGDNVAFCHKWYAILLGQMGDYTSLTDKLNNSFKVKEHALKANELHPKDATTLHVLGRWCSEVAKITWVQRKLASTLFATPPESTNEEALKYYLEAQEAEPNFLRNAILIGDTYVLIKNQTKANEWFKKASEMPVGNDLDKARVNEALSKIK